MPSDVFTPGLVLIVGTLVSISAISVYVSRVYVPAKIKTAYLRSITALAAAVETKESGTLGHAERVAELAVQTARAMGVGERELEQIRYAALLMDIGKAKVPQAILNKSEPLTEEEWALVRSHSAIGSEMVRAVPFLAPLAEYVLHHHEYYDGSGYPAGLKGQEIPLASRILSVAADYDAITSERPYHTRVLSPQEGAEHIRKYSGTKYDPKVVEAFLSIQK